MNPEQSNPYAPPKPLPAERTGVNRGDFDAVTFKKIEAIIKDASQFWIAIILCFVCSALGLVLIGPWYLVRLLQWNSIARTHPKLIVPNAPPNSLEQRFQSAKIKLIIGLCFGLAVFLMFGAVILILFGRITYPRSY